MTGLRAVSEDAPTHVTDRVRDIMVLTVPRLEIDDQITLVEPDEEIPDDGCAKAFAKAFIYDDTPSMHVEDEVYDLMRLAVPSLDAWTADGFIEEQIELPLDGLDSEWLAVECPILAEEMPLHIPEEALSAFSALFATEVGYEARDTLMLKGASPVLAIAAPSPAAMVPATEYAIQEDLSDDRGPPVTFSFGPKNGLEGGWRVCFSF